MDNPLGVMLITGTRTGIGKYLAEYYVQAGYLVEGCSREKPDWEAEGYQHHRVDISDETQVKHMISSVKKRHGQLDVLVNNAGIASMNHILLTPASVVDKIMSVNFRGMFLVCRESVKIMRSQRHGRIINFSTVAVPLNLEGEAIYASSKNAVTTFTKIMAREVAAFGITCNVVGPAPIETNLTRGIPKEKINRVVQQLAVKRMGRFDDVRNVIDFFIKPESDYVTGQVIYLGGIG